MGKGLGSTAVPPHAGVAYDLRVLCKRFDKLNSVRLKDFASAFKAMDMGKIWCGRQSAAELIEFSERLLQMCVTFMMPDRPIHADDPNGRKIEHTDVERVFGIYAAYTFFFLQPSDYVAKIHVTPKELDTIREYQEGFLLKQHHYDVSACLFKLVDANAFQIVPFRASYDPSSHKRFDVPDCEEDVEEGEKEPLKRASDLVEDPLLKQIALLQSKYDEGKEKILKQKRREQKKDLLTEITSLVRSVKVENADNTIRMESLIKEDLDYARKMEEAANSDKANIKNKAYTSKIKHSRNRRYADPKMNDVADPNEKTTPGGRRKRAVVPPPEPVKKGDDVLLVVEDTKPPGRRSSAGKKNAPPKESPAEVIRRVSRTMSQPSVRITENEEDQMPPKETPPEFVRRITRAKSRPSVRITEEDYARFDDEEETTTLSEMRGATSRASACAGKKPQKPGALHVLADPEVSEFLNNPEVDDHITVGSARKSARLTNRPDLVDELKEVAKQYEDSPETKKAEERMNQLLASGPEPKKPRRGRTVMPKAKNE